MSDIKNIADMEKAYGFKFSAAELKMLASDKFVEKDITDTSIRPSSGHQEADREFSDLYGMASGPTDYKMRGQQNAVFYSADVFTNAYNNIYTELLKEMENTVFYPAMTDLSEQFYKAANAHLASATTASDKNKWTKIRNYFAVPYAIFKTAAQPLSAASYSNPDGSQKDPVTVQADYQKQDATVDTYDNAAAFVEKMELDDVSKKAVLSDLKNAYDAANVVTNWTGTGTKTYTFYNTVRGGDQRIATVGLNWYPNNAVRFALDYQWIDVSRLQTPAAVTTAGTAALPTVNGGQKFQTIAFRAQVSF